MSITRTVSTLPCLLAIACGPLVSVPEEGLKSRGDLGNQAAAQGPDMATGLDACGGQLIHLDRVQPNVFLVMDRSGSMSRPISMTSTTTKWDDLKGAIYQLVGAFDSQVRLGMSLFSGVGDCVAGKIDVGLSPQNGAGVMYLLDHSTPTGDTPTAATLANVLRSGTLNDPTRPNVVVLATDGRPNCDDTDVKGKIDQLYASTPSVKTFVIGLGGETASNPALLNEWAVAGHTDRAGDTKYYQSNSAGELSAAFQEIVGGLAQCDFSLANAPPDPSRLHVWLGGSAIALDEIDGYVYLNGQPAVRLNGATCAKFRANPTQAIQVVYDCPLAPPIL